MKKSVLLFFAFALPSGGIAAPYKPPFGSYGYVIGAVNGARGMPADSAKELGPSADGLTFTYTFTSSALDDRIRSYKIQALRRPNKTYAYGFITTHILTYTDLAAVASVALFQSRLAQNCLALSESLSQAYNLWAIEKMSAALDTGEGRYEKTFGGVTARAGAYRDENQRLVIFANGGRSDSVPTKVWPTYCRVK